VLLDIKMPKIDGIEVLRRVKGSELRSIPVVVMISSNEERHVLESYHLGVDGYIVKPVQSTALVSSYQLQR
jgi:two-component system response regulator